MEKKEEGKEEVEEEEEEQEKVERKRRTGLGRLLSIYLRPILSCFLRNLKKATR